VIATKRFAVCDDPTCAAAVELKDINDYPQDWRKVRSTDHLTGPKRKHSEDYYLGSIRLDLCPEHTKAFDAHLPQTIGFGGKKGRPGSVYVSCSCGTDFGRTTSERSTRQSDEPDHYPTRTWWRHLPADLRFQNEPKTEATR
jgi:hypothetical protein